MKIVIDGRLYGLENAGIGRYVMNLVEQLSLAGGENNYDLILRKRYFNQLKLPTNWSKVLFDHRHYSVLEQIGLPKLIKERKADLVHFPHFNVPIGYRGLFVVTIHDLLMHRSKGKETTNLMPGVYHLKRIGYKKVIEYAVRRARKVIVPTRRVKEDILGEYAIEEGGVEVIYEGITGGTVSKEEIKEVRMRYKLNKGYFIYTGNAYPHKNLKRAIEAVVCLNKDLESTGEPAVMFAIVTSRGIFRERLERLIGELGAARYVKLLGFVPDEDLWALYGGSSGFLFPSLLEGFGLPGLEAMKCGTMAMVSDIAVFKEVYRDKAVYFNPYDFSSIEKVMRDVLEMSMDKRRKMVSEGKKFVKKYSWEKMARETLKVYKEAVAL